jgi:hypothetical protein
MPASVRCRRRIVRRCKSDAGIGVTNDTVRPATKADLAQHEGGIRSEPVIMIKKHDGWEINEGWHRTIEHFASRTTGYTAPAWTATAH